MRSTALVSPLRAAGLYPLAGDARASLLVSGGTTFLRLALRRSFDSQKRKDFTTRLGQLKTAREVKLEKN